MKSRSLHLAATTHDASPYLEDDPLGWRIAALCRDEDMALFFHPDGERGNARRTRQESAKRVCERCPVMAQCREFSVTSQEPFGTWGGLTEDERSWLLPRSVVKIRTHRAP